MTSIELFHAVEDLAEDPAIDRIIDGYPGITRFGVSSMTGEGFEGLEIVGASLSLDAMQSIVDRVEGVAQEYGLELHPYRTSIYAGEAYPMFKPASTNERRVREHRRSRSYRPRARNNRSRSRSRRRTNTRRRRMTEAYGYHEQSQELENYVDNQFRDDPDFAFVTVDKHEGMAGVGRDDLYKVELTYDVLPGDPEAFAADVEDALLDPVVDDIVADVERVEPISFDGQTYTQVVADVSLISHEVEEARSTYQLSPDGRRESPYNTPAKRVQQLVDVEFGSDPEFDYVDVVPATGMGGRSDGMFRVEVVYRDYPVPQDVLIDDRDMFIDILSGNKHVKEIRGSEIYKQGDGFEVLIMLHPSMNERRRRSRRSRRIS